MPLKPSQRKTLEAWMRSKAIVHCPLCGGDRWRYAEATYLRTLFDVGKTDLSDAKGVVKISCEDCGCLMLFDAETIGVRGL
jgi:hypothetical protein